MSRVILIAMAKRKMALIVRPKRATVAVQLKVIEGFNPPYLYSQGWRNALAAMNLGNIGDFVNVL